MYSLNSAGSQSLLHLIMEAFMLEAASHAGHDWRLVPTRRLLACAVGDASIRVLHHRTLNWHRLEHCGRQRGGRKQQWVGG